MIWKSKFFEDFTLLDDPLAPSDSDDELRAFIGAKLGLTSHEISRWPQMRVERAILIKWWEWKLHEISSDRIEHHHIRYLCHLVPSTDPDPWFQEKVWTFYDTRREKRKVTNWFGSQNSGKTTTSAVLAIGFGCLHPHLTRQTASGPFKDAGESPLWSAMEETFEEVRITWGDKLADWTGGIFDSKTKKWSSNEEKTTCLMKATSSKGILTFCEAPKAGTIKLVAMDEVGKVQGAKAKDRKQEDGFFIIYLDEIGAGYPTMNILRALHNLRSNRNFHMFTGCNPFTPVGQLDGELGRPTQGYESLKIEEDFSWLSKNGSKTYRFDGLQSPNIVLHCNRWPWLFNEERHQQLLMSTTRDSDFYNSQCRAFMNIGSGNRYVLTIPDIRAGRVDAPFEWSAKDKWKVAFLDPALSTDGDNAILAIIEGGEQRSTAGEMAPILYASKLINIPIFTGKTADAEWVKKCIEVRGQTANSHVLGQLIPVEEQLAINTGAMLAIEGVPRPNFAYDDSMRSKVMEAMLWALGDGPKAVSSVGDPEDIPMYPPSWDVDQSTGKRTLVTWKMHCQKFVSQVWFFGASVVRSGVFRCHPSVMVALDQATQRFWGYAAGGKKRVVESKKEMKDRNHGASPDEADALFGAIYNAYRKGLLKLKIDLPSATEHLTLRSKPQRATEIQMQWKNRRQTTGLHSTGTR